MWMLGADWAVAIGVGVALLASLWAAWTAFQAKSATGRMRARLAKVAEMLEEYLSAQSTSAQLLPTLERQFGPAGRVQVRLRIENIGRGAATHVRIRIGGQLLVSSGSSSDEAREIDEILPGMAVTLPMPPAFAADDDDGRVELNWIDAAGRQQASRTTLRQL